MAEDLKSNLLRAHILGDKLDIDDRYRVSDLFVPADTSDPMDVHTTEELVECLKKNKNIELEARVLGVGKQGAGFVKMGRGEFLEGASKNQVQVERLRESVDYFGTDADFATDSSIVGGPDFTPLLGGPFNKQLYYYDYIRMHARAFYAYHHDPLAKRIVQLMRDFTLGREWKVEFENPQNQAIWDAFCEVNDFYQQMDNIGIELSIYGEVFQWWLPNQETKIAYDVKAGQEPSKGALPRVRLVDPSVFWEIVTYPEDITRVLYYQWVAPTQYQYYSGNDAGKSVGISKFIFQQIPANQISHYKINSVSNEKRGRSDLFPVLGYLKRLRDTVNYSIIALQKASAWCIDTTIDGSEADIDAYVQSQQAIGSIAPAGSEFIHSDKVKRDYLSNSATSRGGGANDAFQWCMSLIAAGTGIPIQYFGTHLSGAGTRASAIVATEPVVKLFEGRQNVYKRIIDDSVRSLFKKFKLVPSNYRIIFPELVVQDRSDKLRDLAVAVGQGWLSQRRAAEIAAKELGILDFTYSKEQEEIEKDGAPSMSPLTAPGKVPGGEPTGIDGEDRRQLDLSKGM